MANQVEFQGANVVITLDAPLKNSTKYHVTVDATAVRDSSGNEFAGIADDTTLSFTTVAASDTTPPTLVNSTPAKDATDVDPSGTITLIFSEEVVAGTGNITISDGAGDDRVIAVV